MQQNKRVSNFARLLLVVVVLAGLVLLPGLPSPFAVVPVYAFVADGPYTVTIATSCRSGTKFCGYKDVAGLGQIDGYAITLITGTDQDFGWGCDNCGDAISGIPVTGSTHWQVSGTKEICVWRTALGGVVGPAMCDSYFGSHAWASDPASGNLPAFPSTTAQVSVGLIVGAPAGDRTARFFVLYNSVSPSATPTPNGTATAVAGLTETAAAATALNGATQTAAAGQTQTPYFATVTEIARQTQTAAPTSTPYPTSIYHSGGNLLQNWDMDIAPIVGSGAAWSTFDRVVQSPIDGDPIGTGHLPGGSCGPKYYDMSSPVGGDTGGTGSMWQQFNFPGGDMFINFEAQTAGLISLGGASITNDDNGLSYFLGNIYNPFGTWTTFKYVLRDMSIAHYTLKFYLQQPAGLSLGGQGFAVDNTNARVGGYGNDCNNTYQGDMPPSTQPIPSPTALINSTLQPPVSAVNLLNNCDFEQGSSSWTNNVGAIPVATGGATGPHFVSLIDFPISTFPLVSLQGDMWQSFAWPGGTMYASFWLKDGGAANLQLTNRTTGFNITYYVTAPGSTATGWTKETFTYPANTAGQYVYDLHTDAGQFAGIDGATIAAGGFAAGPCSSQSTAGGNATQSATQATATAAFVPTSINQTATAAAQLTNDEIIFATTVAGLHQTATAFVSTSNAQTQAAGTQTAAAQLTATAQGTPAPATATPAPTAIASSSPTLAPVPTLPPATQTAITFNLFATQTAIAAYFQTQQANIAASQTALAHNQTAIAQTQTQQASVNGTQQAIIVQTANARQTGTALAATQTQLAGAQATQTAQAGATQTANAHATQTALVATSNATDIAGATAQAQATQTAQAINQATQTAQAIASATAGAIATAAAQATIEVQPRPEPQPYVDCNRPTNPLALADWVDYEVCRVLSWWVWTPSNTQQVLQLKNGLDSYEPLGTLIELDTARNVAQAQLEAYDWANTGLQQEDELPLVVLLFPTHVPTGILTGNIDLTPGHFNIGGLNVNFLTTCSLKVGDIFGAAMAAGLCAVINWLVATGIMGWVQYLFDVAVWIAFLRYAWTLVTTKLPQMM